MESRTKVSGAMVDRLVHEQRLKTIGLVASNSKAAKIKDFTVQDDVY